MEEGIVVSSREIVRPERLDDAPALGASAAGTLLAILERFDARLEESIELGRRLPLPRTESPIGAVLYCGMGGSAIGGDLLGACLGPALTVPLAVNRDYSVPAWVGESTLAFVVSHSGNTRETLAALRGAKRRGAALCCFSSGGEVARLARQQALPWAELPSDLPPRLASIYGLLPPLVVLGRLGVCPEQAEAVLASLPFVRGWCRRLGPDRPAADNPAKQLALLLEGRIPVVMGSAGRLEVLARRWANQVSENAKLPAFFSALPEMGHNELVGWLEAAAGETSALAPVLLEDRDDHPDVRWQSDWLFGQLEQEGRWPVRVSSRGEGWWERLWSLLLLGDFASLYLAWLRGHDPLPVKPIDRMKAALPEHEPEEEP